MKKRKNGNPPPVDPPQHVPIAKHPKHIFFNYDDEQDTDEDYVPPLIESEDEDTKPDSSSSSTSEDEEEYEDEDDWDDDDDEYPYDEECLDHEDVAILERLRREQPKLFDRYVLAKEIIESRELSIMDILKADMTDEKRANMIEQFEILRQIQPCTDDYLEQRDKLRSMFFKYVAEYMLPPKAAFVPPPAALRIPKSDTQLEVANMRKKVMALTLSAGNQKILEEKIDEFEDIEKGDEKTKLKRWINLALQLPFDRLTSESSFETDPLAERLKRTEEHLNRKLFGMKSVKERLMLFLNKKLREGNSRGCNIALVGKPGVGKCLHPLTPVRMFDLSIKAAGEIQAGELLRGDDDKPRLVLSTVRGKEELYEVISEYGESYTVNKSHILSLTHVSTGVVRDVPIKEFIDSRERLSDFTCYQACYFGSVQIHPNEIETMCSQFRGVFHSSFGSLPSEYLQWTKNSKQHFVSSLFQSNENKVTIARNRPIQQILDLLRSSGLRCKCTICPQNEDYVVIEHVLPNQTEKWFVERKHVGQYAGFVIDGNHRFVLGDWTVTHNTAIAKSLSECLKIPFAQLSFGGVSNAEFLMGHDYTYVGSRPGEITRCMTRLGVKNGILFFDEFDKATDKKDIMSTLLHVTDFSQNNEFRDSYFPELTQDLSKIWFIYSMNELPTDPAMLDRLEVIYVDEYTTDERVQIVENYLFTKYIRELKLENQIVLEPSGAKQLVTYSSGGMDKRGVRELERYLNLVVEKVFFFLSNKDQPYDYPWFKKTKEYVDVENGKVHVTDVLVQHILADKRREQDGRNVYLNLYM